MKSVIGALVGAMDKNYKISKKKEYIKPLSSYAEQREVGGKAYNLMKLIHANYNVPDGFVVTTKSYRYWKKNKRLPSEIFDELKRYLEWFSYSMQFPLIVRSSATVEDAGKASFAGIFTSYPNAKSIEDIIERIEKIYSDANSTRVVDYCKLHRIKLDSVEMAVLVQKQLNPKYSGILFTRNPVNGKDEIVLEYVDGVPWNLASGSEEHTNRIILSEKSKKFNELHRISKEIEEFFALPQDIEWAYDGKLYWILQSRPITTLKNNNFRKTVRSSPKSAVVLTGTTASLGYAKGKIQYIFDNVPVDEAERVFRKNNILATLLLYPEYDCVISKSKGVIAQTSSINSHVAIFARERRIPCIVGVDLKVLSRYAGDFDEVIVDANNGKVIIPKPRIPKIHDKSKSVSWSIPEWAKKVNSEGLRLIRNLKKAILEENVDEFEDGIEKIIAYIMDNASNKPEISRPLFHRLAEFLQEDFVSILLTKYPKEKVLERFSFIDSNPKAQPQETIDKLYIVVKKYVNSLDLLEVNGKKIFELEIPEDKPLGNSKSI